MTKVETGFWEDVQAIRCGDEMSDDTSCHVVHVGYDGDLEEDHLEDVNVALTSKYSGGEIENIDEASYVDGRFSLISRDRSMACAKDSDGRLRCGSRGHIKDIHLQRVRNQRYNQI